MNESGANANYMYQICHTADMDDLDREHNRAMEKREKANQKELDRRIRELEDQAQRELDNELKNLKKKMQSDNDLELRDFVSTRL